MIRHGIVRWTREDVPGYEHHLLNVSLWRWGFILHWRGKYVPAAYDATFGFDYQESLDTKINAQVGDEAFPLDFRPPPPTIKEPRPVIDLFQSRVA
jgi:hypothetical protein